MFWAVAVTLPQFSTTTLKQSNAMKRQLLIFMMAVAALANHAYTVTDTIFNRSDHEDYAFGADVSFVPMMESRKALA